MNLFADVLAAIVPPDAEAMAAARERQDRMTKPRGSLGALEEVSVRLAGLAAAARRRCPNRPVSRSSPPTTACTPRGLPRGRRR